MKHINLQILKDNGINVPPFIVVQNPFLMELRFSEAELFAVRSSFEVEDNENISFAGQFETFLNVPRDDVKKMAEKIILNPLPKEYCEHYNIDPMFCRRVIVQEMITADMSGVIFTSNPQGILNELVIVVGNGTGNNIVEDKTPTTSYFYNKDDGIYYFEQQENAPVIDAKTIKELVETAKKIENIFDKPMDIEYAIKDNVIYILQARPITTINQDNMIVLDNSNIIESYPGISLPLTQSFVKQIYYEIFRNLIYRLTENQDIVDLLDSDIQDMVDIANWRIYYNISNWYNVISMLPFSEKIIPIWQNMMGVNNKTVSKSDFYVPQATKRTIFKNFIKFLRTTPKMMDELNSNFEVKFPEYVDKVSKSETIKQLLNSYEYMRKDILTNWDVTLINDMYGFIYTYLAGEKNNSYISNIKNLESMKPANAMNNLIKTAHDYGMDSNVYLLEKMNYIANYGDRCAGELKLETETYKTNPAALDEFIKINIDNYLSYPAQDFENYKKDSFFVKRAKLGIKNREISRLNRSKIFGLTREIFRKIGQKLYDSRFIDNPLDVFYLKIDEIEEKNLRQLIKTRKEEEMNYLSVPAYSRLVFTNKITNKNIHNKTNILDIPNQLHGFGVSDGKVTGEIIVIDENNLNVDTTNKIIVTKSTDPGWVFIIKNSIGIIAERGSLLSHTAIISRELHKPSIVNVKDCTKLLKTGDIVEMDTDTGIIIIKNQQKY